MKFLRNAHIFKTTTQKRKKEKVHILNTVFYFVTYKDRVDIFNPPPPIIDKVKNAPPEIRLSL